LIIPRACSSSSDISNPDLEVSCEEDSGHGADRADRVARIGCGSISENAQDTVGFNKGAATYVTFHVSRPDRLSRAPGPATRRGRRTQWSSSAAAQGLGYGRPPLAAQSDGCVRVGCRLASSQLVTAGTMVCVIRIWGLRSSFSGSLVMTVTRSRSGTT
jgi:hypothetical protein